jgi:UDP-N-acetylglucosamine--N-acetylmuramyl-(pentapeptide) pyrophosphoryl-undecaprenol N-acetylglucosamine transferase
MAATRPLNILIACGGTGGHLFPGIAVAEAFRAQGHTPLLLISRKEIDATATASHDHLKFAAVPAIAKPPTLSPRMPAFLWNLWRSVRQARETIRSGGIDAVLGMGGFTSLPPVFAGHRLGLPTFVHDSNARPGRANLVTSRFCTRVFVGMEAARPWFTRADSQHTGTPVRPEILNLPPRAEAAASFGLAADRPTLLITGGSQGARRLNEIAAEAAASLDPSWQILHIAGPADESRVATTLASRPGTKVLGFCSAMHNAYAAADLVIARAGASSLTELTAAGLPAILVPYPYAADDHQTANATVAADAGAAILIQERDLDGPRLAAAVKSILDHPETLDAMAAAATRMAIPDAAERVRDAILETIRTRSA